MLENNFEIIEADFKNQTHRKAIPYLLNEYTKDLLGYNKELPEDVLNKIVDGIESFQTGIVILAQKENEVIGMAILFLNFSTFKAQPLINIHDFTVLKSKRNQGIGKRILKKIEEIAIEKGCCKITLETQENNIIARKLYNSFGFSDSFLDDEAGKQLFLTKEL